MLFHGMRSRNRRRQGSRLEQTAPHQMQISFQRAQRQGKNNEGRTPHGNNKTRS